MSAILGNRAVVVGAGMGGMMAAGILSRFFTEVIVLDKDPLPKDIEPRKSAPQGAHAHALLVQGRRNLEQIFPGFTSALIDRGAICTRAGTEFIIRDAQGWQPKNELGLMVLSMTRPLLETTVRELLRQCKTVSIRENVRVEGWGFKDDVLTSVTVNGLEGKESIDTDFVVDATGRSGKSLSWIESGGFGPVEETALEIGTGYASALFKKPSGWESSVDSMAISAADPDTRGGFVFSVENQCWIASITGRFDQQPGNDPDEFMEFARNLCEPDFYNWISQGERISPIRAYRAPVSRWRHYEKLDRFPKHILPVGDALAHVNPVYGQGMTLASVQIMSLWEILNEIAETGGSTNEIAKPYFERIHGFIEGVWGGLENLEFQYSGTRGQRPADIDDRIAYSYGLRKLIEQDSEIQRLMLETNHLVRSGEALGEPAVRSRVMNILKAEAKVA